MGPVPIQYSDDPNVCSRAILGLFLFGEENVAYGLINEHFVLRSGDVIYRRNDNNDLIELGRPLRGGDGRCFFDVELARIRPEEVLNCDTVFRNRYGNPCAAELFVGKVPDLYGKELLVYTSVYNASRGLLEVCTPVLKRTTVASEEDHLLNVSTGTIAAHFFVRSHGDPVVPGDSGAILVHHRSDEVVELVGIVQGGKRRKTNRAAGCQTSLEQDADRDEPFVFDLVRCTLLRKAIANLEKKYQKKFRFCKKAENQKRQATSLIRVQKRKKILQNFTGMTVASRLNAVEELVKVDVNIMERIARHVSLLEDGIFASEDPSSEESPYERMLCKAVNARSEIVHHKPSSDSPDMVCYFYCLSGCEFLYRGLFGHAQKDLKEACKSVMRTRFRERHLRKLVQMASYLFLQKQEDQQMEELYRMTKAFMDAIDSRDPSSLRILGYFYANFALFFNRTGRRLEALTLASAGVELFRQYHVDDKLKAQGLGFSLVAFVRILLDCDEFFESRNTHAIRETLTLAEENLKLVPGGREELPILDANFQLADSELRTRKGDIRGAFVSAKRGVELAGSFKLQDVEQQGKAHIETLRSQYQRRLRACECALLLGLVPLAFFLLFFFHSLLYLERFSGL